MDCCCVVLGCAETGGVDSCIEVGCRGESWGGGGGGGGGRQMN